MFRRIRILCADIRGVAAIEFAFALPILCLMVFGIYEMAQGISCYYRLMDAANSVADLISQTTSSEGGIGNVDFDNYYTAGQLVMTPNTGSGLQLAMASVTFDANGKFSSVAWQITRGSGTTTMSNTALQSATVNLAVTNGSVIVVQATYSYHSVLNYFIKAPIKMTYDAYALPRNMSSIPCPPSSGGESCS